MARSRPSFVASSTLVVVALVGASLAAAAAPAAAVSPAQSTVVNAVPASYTPNINDGITYAIGSVGSTIFVGGSFTNESPQGSSTVISQPYLFSFTEGTGVINTSFAPTLDGEVDSIAAGPAANEVYVAGQFKTVDGVKERVALLNATTGQIVSGWKPATFNGDINKIELDGSQLIVGGYFTLANNTVARAGIASLRATNGELTDYAANQFTGHHNYGVNCDPTQSQCASAGTGIKSFDISPDGTRLAAIGNFTSVDGSPRDQAAVLDLGATSSVVDPNWSTLAYTAACYSGSFDTYVRDVQFSPDGSYFVIVGTGGSGTNTDGTNSSCDSAARYNTATTGANVRPTWIDYTGNDSLLSVAISGTAVYAGGHQRWLNNSMGLDFAGAGAVARPGIVALDPQNGLPLVWNPGRNPRGAGAYSLLLTSQGLYVGSDTDYIGDDAYLRKKIAFFPTAGGETLPANTVGSLPGTVYLIGGPTGTHSARSLTWDGSSSPGAVSTLPSQSIDWSVAHGAFDVNGKVYYAESDGYLHLRTFDGTTFGPDVTVDPYDDPAWDTVPTGSGGATPYYKGTQSTMSAEMPNVTSMFYSAGRIYYTLSGSSSMFWRWFEPDSGVIGSDEFTTGGGIDWSSTAGAFLVGSTLYFAKSSGSSLYSVPFQNGQANGTPVVANNSVDWRSAGAFVLTKPQVVNAPPTASFTSNCSKSTCSFNASASSDSDGTIASYAWKFGDGATDTTTSATDSHTYAAAGSYTVTLTVTDNDGATNSVSHAVSIAGAAPAPTVTYVGATAATANAATVATTIPAGTQAGDALLLSEAFASTTLTLSAPSGWTLVGTTSHSNLTTDVFERVAQAGDAGTTVTMQLSGTVKSSLVIAAYANTDKTAPVESSASTVGSSQTVTAPALSGLSAGTWVVRIYVDKSSATTAWTAPGDTTTRESVLATGAGAANTLFVDSNGAVGSSVSTDSASTNDKSGSEAAWTISLKPVSAV